MNKNYRKVNEILGDFESSVVTYSRKLDDFYNSLDEVFSKIHEEDKIKEELQNYMTHFKKLRKSFVQGIHNEEELSSRNKLVEMIVKSKNRGSEENAN